jgi:hypothetical protein
MSPNLSAQLRFAIEAASDQIFPGDFSLVANVSPEGQCAIIFRRGVPGGHGWIEVSWKYHVLGTFGKGDQCLGGAEQAAHVEISELQPAQLAFADQSRFAVADRSDQVAIGPVFAGVTTKFNGFAHFCLQSDEAIRLGRN